MAIVKISAPLATSPAVFAAPVVNQLAALTINMAKGSDVKNGSHIRSGALFNIGGVMFIADSDTAITGVASSYVKLTVTGDSAAASFVADLTGVSWNDAYKGYYDVGGALYLFDEDIALADEQIEEYAKGFSVKRNNVNTGERIKIYNTSAFGDYNKTTTALQRNVSPGGTWVSIYQFVLTSQFSLPFTVRRFNMRIIVSVFLGTPSFRVIDEDDNVIETFVTTGSGTYDYTVDTDSAETKTKTYRIQTKDYGFLGTASLQCFFSLCGDGEPSDFQAIALMCGGVTGQVLSL